MQKNNRIYRKKLVASHEMREAYVHRRNNTTYQNLGHVTQTCIKLSNPMMPLLSSSIMI